MSSPLPGVLVSADDVAAHPEWRVFDCRHDLKNTGYGRQAYARGHIPGALFLHLDDDLSGVKTGSNGRHPLPEVAAFARHMSDCGVGDDVQPRARTGAASQVGVSPAPISIAISARANIACARDSRFTSSISGTSAAAKAATSPIRRARRARAGLSASAAAASARR